VKLILYVADEFKSLEGGKTLAVGLFTDRVVVLNIPRDVPPPTREVPYGVPLGLLACVMDAPATELNGLASIAPPSGPSTMSLPRVSTKGPVGGSHNLRFHLDPFLMTEEGNYTFSLEFDGFPRLSETFEFRIRKVDNSATEAVLVQQTVQPLSPAG
jgi:hypothetical protein